MAIRTRSEELMAVLAKMDKELKELRSHGYTNTDLEQRSELLTQDLMRAGEEEQQWREPESGDWKEDNLESDFT